MSISLATGSRALADGPEYISEDAKVAGKVVHTFADGGQDVVVVLGGFDMKVGKRTLTGDQAVLWIKENKAGNVVRRDIAVYIKGNAKIVEANGTETGDKTILVTVHQQGKLSARGQMSAQSLIDDPLYTEALAVRTGKPIPVGSTTVASTGKSTGAEPTGIDASLPPARRDTAATQLAAGQADTEPATKDATELASTQPATTQIVAANETPSKTPATKPAVKAKPAVKPAEPLAVTFRPESFSVEEMGKDKHIIVATNVYLSQGNTDSDTFMVMQAQTAAVFTAPADKKTNPRAPQLIGMAGKSGSAGESVIGVYLEGDVRMTRGDRYMRARSLYYDFVNDRAIILDPVFRTIQEQRNVPIYIRAREARQLSANEIFFKDAKITTS
ncbi:MAG: hypothetical protein EHM48_08820, partial [Planctomycetaceae bacterium]